MMPAIERVAAATGGPTYYETLLALAFAHFARERVDVAVDRSRSGRTARRHERAAAGRDGDHVGRLRPHRRPRQTRWRRSPAKRRGSRSRTSRWSLRTCRAGGAAVVEECAARPGRRWFGSATPCASRRVPPAGEYVQAFVAITAHARYRVDLPVLRPLSECQRRHGNRRARAACRFAAARPAQRRARVRARRNSRPDGSLCREPADRFRHRSQRREGRSVWSHRCANEFPGRRIHYVVAIGESKDAARILDDPDVRAGDVDVHLVRGRRTARDRAATAARNRAKPLGTRGERSPIRSRHSRPRAAAPRRTTSWSSRVRRSSSLRLREWWLAETAAGERSA